MTHDGSDVLKIGSVLCADVDLKYRHAFLKHKNIKFGRQREKRNLTVSLFSTSRLAPTRMLLKAASAHQILLPWVLTLQVTRPVCLLVDGDITLYRVANVLHECKECYVAPKNAVDKSQLNSGVAHPVEWVTMTNAYNKVYDPAHPDTSIDCMYQYTQFDVFHVDEMAASQFNENLSVGEFMQIVGYMEGQYAACLKRSKVSGDHGEFMEYTNGLIWLAYMHCCFMLVGDSSLHNTVPAELTDGVLNESISGAPGARNRSQSSSLIPPGSNPKLVASLAIQGAASSINNRMNDLNRADNFNTTMQLTDEKKKWRRFMTGSEQ
ncbi:hypothetical protein ACHAW6_000706 [Cyclotella cf. meneghiniana]